MAADFCSNIRNLGYWVNCKQLIKGLFRQNANLKWQWSKIFCNTLHYADEIKNIHKKLDIFKIPK